jgi:hypothetical protein
MEETREGSIYNCWVDGLAPHDEELLALGYTSGDLVWASGCGRYWFVTKSDYRAQNDQMFLGEIGG